MILSVEERLLQRGFGSFLSLDLEQETAVLGGPHCSDKVPFSVVYGTGTMPSDNASKGGQGPGRFSKPSGKVFFPHKGGGSTVARLPALLHDSFNGHVQARLVVL